MTIAEYLISLADLHDKNKSVHGDYYRWLVSQSQPIQIRPKKQLPAALLEKLKGQRAAIKQCHRTAGRLVQDIPGVKLVQGYSMGAVIPVEHSWNVYEGVHFDLTAELWRRKGITAESYAQIAIFNELQMSRFLSERNMWGWYIRDFYYERADKEILPRPQVTRTA